MLYRKKCIYSIRRVAILHVKIPIYSISQVAILQINMVNTIRRVAILQIKMHTFYTKYDNISSQNVYVIQVGLPYCTYKCIYIYKYSMGWIAILNQKNKYILWGGLPHCMQNCIHSIRRTAILHAEINILYEQIAMCHIATKLHIFYSADCHIASKNAYILWGRLPCCT